jgi:hypothetical protein
MEGLNNDVEGEAEGSEPHTEEDEEEVSQKKGLY